MVRPISFVFILIAAASFYFGVAFWSLNLLHRQTQKLDTI
jgi:hypothetical protein